jgi:DNA-binding MarR family transcriptional regulator
MEKLTDQNIKTTDNNSEDITLAEYQALAEIRYQIRRFLHFSEQASRAIGLEPQQHQLLLALKGLPDGRSASVADLAERLQIQHHSTVELINRMVDRALLTRSRAAHDQRQVLVQLTPSGEAMLQQLSLQHRTELRSTAPTLMQVLANFVKADSEIESKELKES